MGIIFEDERTKTNRALAEPTGSITPHILLWLVQIVVLAAPKFRYRRFVCGSAIIGLAVASQINPYFTKDVSTAQPFTIGWANYLSTLEKVLFSGPGEWEGSFWHVDQPAREATAYTAFGFSKLKWALVLLINLRGIRWNFQVKNVPKAPRETKWQFLRRQAVNVAYYLIMADLMVQLGIRFFYTLPDGRVGDMNTKYITLRHADWRWDFIKAFVFGATPYYMVCLQYNMFSLPAVLLGISKPEDWPPAFGPISTATTVRQFWGVYWHQTVRRVLNSWTGALVDFLRIPRGTNASSYTQLWAAFLLSGCMHANSMLGLPAPANITRSERTLGMLQFFLFHAAAITFEDFVQWVWRALGGGAAEEGGVQGGRRVDGKTEGGKGEGSSMLRRLVGYCWVVGCFWYSMHFAADVMLRMRLMEESFLPFTVVGGWVRMLPIPS